MLIFLAIETFDLRVKKVGEDDVSVETDSVINLAKKWSVPTESGGIQNRPLGFGNISNPPNKEAYIEGLSSVGVEPFMLTIDGNDAVAYSFNPLFVDMSSINSDIVNDGNDRVHKFSIGSLSSEEIGAEWTTITTEGEITSPTDVILTDHRPWLLFRKPDIS